MTTEEVTAAVSNFQDLIKEHNPTRTLIRFEDIELDDLSKFVKEKNLMMWPPDMETNYWFAIWELPNISVHLTTKDLT